MKLKYYMRGVGVGILFTMFVFLVIIIPNLELNQIVSEKTASSESAADVSGLLGVKEEAASDTDLPDQVDEQTSLSDDKTELIDTKDAVADSTDDVSAATPGAISMNGEENTQAELQSAENSSTTADADAAENTETSENAADAENADSQGDVSPSPDQTEENAQSASDSTQQENVTTSDGNVITAKISITGGMTSERFCRKAEESGIVTSWEELNEYMVDHGYARKLQTDSYTLSSDMTFEQICKIITQTR